MAAPMNNVILGQFLQLFIETSDQTLILQRKQHLTAACACIAFYLTLPREIVPKVSFFVEDVVPAMSSGDFKKHFRIENETYLVVLEKLYPFLVSDNTGGKEQAPPEKQLLMFIWYMANQDCMRELSLLFDLSLSTVHSTVLKVSKLIYRVFDKIIQWPDEERQGEIEREFQLQCGVPNIVGLVDGTHIQLSHVPNGDNDYVNRKGYPSIQLQLVVDHDLMITSAYTGWPGCAHDARVLRNSGLHDRAESGALVNPDRHLIGDSAYPLRTWLITPFRDNGHLSRQQKKFNQTLSCCRQSVERAIGHLKCRFRRLREVPLYNMEYISYFILDGCILHNLCVMNNDNLNQFLDDCIDIDANPNGYQNVFPNGVGADAKRNQLVQLIA